MHPLPETAAARRTDAEPARGGAAAIAALALYAALAVASTWPLARHPGTTVVQGTEAATTVPLAMSWALWWTADRLTHGFRGYRDAPILFFPTEGAFAFSEAMPVLGVLAAPVIQASGSPLLGHSFILFLALVTNGLTARWLLRTLGIGSLGSLAGGALAVVLPYVHAEIGVLTLVPLAPALLCLRFAIVTARDPTAWRAAALGASGALTYLCCAQYAVFVALSIAAAAPLLLRRRHLNRRGGIALVLCLSCALVPVIPMAVVQELSMRAQRFDRTEKRQTKGAASKTVWLSTAWRPVVPVPGVETRPGGRTLFPGAIKLVLALAGCAWALAASARRREHAFLPCVGIAAGLLASVPYLDVGALSANDVLRAVVPGFSKIRSVFRAGVLTQISIALMAGVGIHAMATALPGRRRLRAALALVALTAACAELWPRDRTFAPAPDLDAWSELVQWVRENVPEGTAIAHLPPAGKSVQDLEETAEWMYVATQHGRPLVNGYSSFFPHAYRENNQSLRDFPLDDSRRALLERDIRFIVARRSYVDGLAVVPAPSVWPVRFLDGDLVVFEALPDPQQSPDP